MNPANRSQSSTRLRVTREGFAYGVILIFVASAAILRNINLLILLSGLMIAPLLLSWRISRTGLRHLETRRIAKPVVFAGQSENVYWEVVNRRSFVPAWNLMIADRVTPKQGSASRNRQPIAGVVIREIPPGGNASGHYRVSFPERGNFWLGPVNISTRFPFGLVESSFDLADRQSIVVAPRIGRLATGWDRRIFSTAVGDSATQRRRALMGDEFFAVRQWRTGDSVRNIHWRSSARQNLPMVRQYDRRSDRDIVVLLDLYSTGPDEGSLSDNKVELALSFAATVVVQAGREIEGRLIVGVAGSTVTMVESSPEARVFRNELIFADLSEASGAIQPDLEKLFTEAANVVESGSPIYVVSTRQSIEDEFVRIAEQDPDRFNSMRPWVRFLDVEGEDFRSVFSAPPDETAGAPENDKPVSGTVTAGEVLT